MFEVTMNKKNRTNHDQIKQLYNYLLCCGRITSEGSQMFWLIAINFSQKSPHFCLLSSTSPCDLPEREVTSPSNLKVVRAQQIIWLF